MSYHPFGGRKLTFGSYSLYVLPSVVTMLFMALYTIVDGAFIALFVNSDALAGQNLVYPINNLSLGLGIMFATGSNAQVSMLLGEGKPKEANEKFTLTVVTAGIVGLVTTGLLLIFFRPLLDFLGAEERTWTYCVQYGLVLVLTAPLVILKEVLVSFLRVDGQPRLSMVATILGGITNIVLDYVFMVIFDWGVLGAAIATSLGILLGACVALWYFLSGRSKMRFTRLRMDGGYLLRISGNGSSEMVNQLSAGITTLLFNLIALHYHGPDGVAAVTIMIYAEFVLISLFLGLAMGCASPISYQYGCRDFSGNRRILRYSVIWVACGSLALFLCAFFKPEWPVLCFVREGTAVFDLAKQGLFLFSFSLIFSGGNIFASGLFTALGNGLVSALIAFCRSILFLAGSLLLLPRWLGFDGVWLAIPVAETLTCVVVWVCLFRWRKTYHLWGKEL